MDLKEAAQHLGVHYQTVYQWVREGRLPAEKVGASYQVKTEDVQTLQQERSTPTPPPPQTVVRDWEAQRERLLGLLLAGDEPGVRTQLNRLADGRVPVLDICDHLIGPVLFRIGDLWATGKITIAEEHRSSAIVERGLAAMMNNPPGRPRGTIVVTTPPGDEHSLPATMATAVLRNLRWTTHHLGTQVPKEDVAKISHDVQADLVIITVTNPAAEGSAADVAAHVRSEGFEVHVGSPGKSLRELTHLH